MLQAIEAAVTAASETKATELTVSQKQRLAHLMGIYSSDLTAKQLVRLLEPRGENCWKAVNEKIDNLLRADHIQQMYHDMLYDNFIINTPYSFDDIIRIVGSVRRDLRLPTYISSLKRNCVNDFLSLFIICTISTDMNCVGDSEAPTHPRSVIYGYKPLFRLKPDEE